MEITIKADPKEVAVLLEVLRGGKEVAIDAKTLAGVGRCACEDIRMPLDESLLVRGIIGRADSPAYCAESNKATGTRC